ncbi:hypothetical protein FE391_16830 [Nonomuraea sp. KC401]|uniref:hypothetical protein n=1 Tax=unclassified Nonomuraea TaxID=2593643 RepID=UPI0010FF10F9|nr:MULTISPECIES: hypothetical protein [unclassified Nonomuraea]NBE95271.1 hypothetical protein [Nonomuraea sp. K271]TLF72369.1 hypothetical protein FE391_16830 [Nonomuraea sp. KC401]
MPVTYTYTPGSRSGFTYAALSNRNKESGSLDFNVLSPRMNAEIGKVTIWLTTDLVAAPTWRRRGLIDRALPVCGGHRGWCVLFWRATLHARTWRW